MKVKIYDLSQFFKICQIQIGLTTIAEQNHQIPDKEISNIQKSINKSILISLKQKLPLKEFRNHYKFTMRDLDLIPIALSEQLKTKNV